jgi:pyridinium-3,5-bisthiocarboxylic acid mononucleotide nickel chelatase
MSDDRGRIHRHAHSGERTTPNNHDHPHDGAHSHDHERPPAHDQVEHARLHSRGEAAPLQAWQPRDPASVPTPLIYIDCFSGVAGDMLVGALLDAGLPRVDLEAGLGALDLGGYRLQVATKQSYGITGTKLDVLVDEAAQPERRLADILELLERSQLSPWVRTSAEAVFRRLAVAEATIHASTIDAVHFHEVGAVDSIVDVVGCLIGLELLGVREIHASSLPLPGGTVRAQHGLLPAPAPATLEILAAVGAPTRPSPVLGELVTPTGAAIVAELATFEQPLMRVRRVGYGYGARELPWPNVVRVWLGERWSPAPPRIAEWGATFRSDLTSSPSPTQRAEQATSPAPPPRTEERRRDELAEGGLHADDVTVIECNLDDSTPEQLGYAMEQLLAAGALDVYFTSIQMKKNRPGVLLGVIARPDQSRDLAALMLRETTTLGVRMQQAHRLVAGRRIETVPTPFGPVRVKLKLFADRAVAAPEYEDCAALARAHGVSLTDVYRAAQIAAEALDQ